MPNESLALRIFAFFGVSLSIVFAYYQVPFHAESFANYKWYIVSILTIYGIYKFFKVSLSGDATRYSILEMIGYALLHIVVLCGMFFYLSNPDHSTNGSGTLFFSILGYLFLPTIIVVISASFGKKILSLIKKDLKLTNSFIVLFSLGLGLAWFISILAVASFIKLYSITTVFLILAVFAAVSYRELLDILSLSIKPIFQLPSHKGNGTFFEQINLHLLSTEFLFIVLTFLIGVNFINIVRPMPIGWDDLGVYMNYPNMIAAAGGLPAGFGFAGWQIFTGIGFLFESNTQAFFMNQVGGILMVVALAFAVLWLTQRAGKHNFLNLPLLMSTAMYATPMIIFQQAKDMKLDPALLFFTIVSIYGLVEIFHQYHEHKNSPEGALTTPTSSSGFLLCREMMLLIGIVGVLIGFSFVVKVTTLMLILGAIGLISYALLGIEGFMGYFLLFLTTFTQLRLWDMLNVNYPKNEPNTLLAFVGVTGILSVLCFAFVAYKKGAERILTAVKVALILGIGIMLPITPWIAKNISELKGSPITINTLLGGKGEAFQADMTKIFSQQELDAKEKLYNVQNIDSSGKTLNEDMGRYFGYESGINNYIKLPVNLTLQNNQRGEYTDITYFFLALIPAVFLFLGFRNVYGIVGTILMIAWIIALFPSATFLGTIGIEDIVSQWLAALSLPKWYFAIIAVMLCPILIFHYTLRKSKENEQFMHVLSIFTVYAFIFVISAYGIVWYGIAVYALMFFLSVLALITINTVDKLKEDTGTTVRFIGSVVLLVMMSIYFFSSSFPHGFNNLQGAGFWEYKKWYQEQEVAIFTSHPDYVKILLTLNIKDQWQLFDVIFSTIDVSSAFGSFLTNLNGDVYAQIKQHRNTLELEYVLKSAISYAGSQLSSSQISAENKALFARISQQANQVLKKLYQTILRPSAELRNDGIIYRIGTFLTFFISRNNARYYDDSLIFQLDRYFWTGNPDTTVKKMKDIGLSYLLADLNAATIDQDPRHNLTARFENLLRTFTSSGLELIQTDNICLQMALDEKDTDYMTMAGVNYESYEKDASGVEKTINRNEKTSYCMNKIYNTITSGKVVDWKYSYLNPLKEMLTRENLLQEKLNNDQMNRLRNIMGYYVNHGWLALFRIK